MIRHLFGRCVFEVKDLNNLTAKEKTKLLRIYAGKGSKNILTPNQLQKAKDITDGNSNN